MVYKYSVFIQVGVVPLLRVGKQYPPGVKNPTWENLV